MPELITNSKASCFRACPRKYWYNYELCLNPFIEPEALTFGSLFHELLASYYRGTLGDTQENILEAWGAKKRERIETFRALTPEDEAEIEEQKELASNLLDAYGERYAEESLKVLGVEVPFRFKLSEGWDFLGTIDLVAEETETGLLVILDHKTTSLGKAEDYCRFLDWNFQLEGYAWAILHDRPNLKWAGYNIIRKKLPSEPTALQCKKCKGKEGKKEECSDCGGSGVGAISENKRVDTTSDVYIQTIRRYSHLSVGDYMEMIEWLRHDKDPNFYHRRLYDVGEMNLDVWQEDLLSVCSAIEAARERKSPWYRNDDACRTRPCEYRGLCKGFPSADKEFYMREDDLPEISDDEVPTEYGVCWEGRGQRPPEEEEMIGEIPF